MAKTPLKDAVIEIVAGLADRSATGLVVVLSAFTAEWLKNRVFTSRVRLSCPKLVDVNSL